MDSGKATSLVYRLPCHDLFFIRILGATRIGSVAAVCETQMSCDGLSRVLFIFIPPKEFLFRNRQSRKSRYAHLALHALAPPPRRRHVTCGTETVGKCCCYCCARTQGLGLPLAHNRVCEPAGPSRCVGRWLFHCPLLFPWEGIPSLASTYAASI